MEKAGGIDDFPLWHDLIINLCTRFGSIDGGFIVLIANIVLIVHLIACLIGLIQQKLFVFL